MPEMTDEAPVRETGEQSMWSRVENDENTERTVPKEEIPPVDQGLPTSPHETDNENPQSA